MKKAAFTLVELLVVIAIIGILVAILIPTVASGMEKSRKVKCMAQLRQISIGVQTQFDETKRFMPFRKNKDISGQACYDLLPYVGDDPSVFRCPSQSYPQQDAKFLIKDVDDTGDDKGVYSDYEFNAYLCSCDARGDAPKSLIEDYSLAAIAYDYPYEPDGSLGKRAHKGGINIAFMDGHAAWVEDADLYAETDTTNSFYRKGHTVAEWEKN